MSNRLRISLVIPVYNEESHLADCLQAVLAQRIPFDEIIVVDNNSTDGTSAIAASFRGVTVLSVFKQGVVHARNAGFTVASGDVIARIDADTRLPSNWTEQLLAVFQDSAVDAATGVITYHDIGGRRIIDKSDALIRHWLADKMSNRMFLLGANMAIRRSTWQKVANDTCSDAGLHEDLDLAVHLSDAGCKVLFAPNLVAGVSGRRIDTNLVDFVRYLRSLPRTYAIHGTSEQRYMYPVAALVLLHYLPLRLLYRCYDAQTDRFHWSRLFGAQVSQRVNPTLFVD